MKLGERVVHRLKSRIENIGIVIPKSDGPASEVVRGKGHVLSHLVRENDLGALGGRKQALTQYALLHPDELLDQINLPDPKKAEAAFHDQLAKKRQPSDYDDHFVPVEEREIGIIPYQPGGDPRIKYFKNIYGLPEIKPKVLIDKAGKPVYVKDYARLNGEVVGNLAIPFEEVERPVRVPDIAGAIAVKGTQELIARLGLADNTKPEAIFGRQAVLRTAIVNYAEANEIGLSPDFIKFTVNAFLFLAEHPELQGGEVIPALLKQKK